VTKSPDALTLLTRDHEAVRQLFSAFKALARSDAPADEEKAALAEQICMHLSVHAQVEEEIFYPAVRESIDDDAVMDEAEVEHATAKDLIADISAMRPADALFDATVAVLGEYVDHHVKVEQRDMFPKAKKAGLDLAELGAEIAARKKTLLNEYGGQTARLRWEDEDADPVGRRV
jgi:hemerythrin-like domain-containing protein